MTAPGRVLENHTLVVRDGRILDLLPSAQPPNAMPPPWRCSGPRIC